MSKTVLDVGNCGPDFGAIRKMLTSNFDVQVLQAQNSAEALDVLRSNNVDLVLVNRKLDEDYSDGIEVIRSLKSDPLLTKIPVMLVTNLEEHQQLALSLGAIRGFGKLALNSSQTIELVAEVLKN